MRKWYAVYTRPSAEKKVVENLTRKGIVNYCPFHHVKKNWQRGKGTEQALFRSIVFVHVVEAQLPLLKNVEGIISLLYWFGNPVELREVEVDVMRRFISVHQNIEVSRIDVERDAIVQLSSVGVVKGGDKEEQAKKITLQLPSIGFCLAAPILLPERIKDTVLMEAEWPKENGFVGTLMAH